MNWFLNLYVFVVGACLGSFINVVIHRVPKGISLITPSSRCPACETKIRWYDNLPLISYIVLRGRCRNCQVRISPRYFLVELTVGLLVMAVFIKYGIHARTLVGIYMVCSLMALTYIDLDEMIIPDIITIPGILVGVLSAFLFPDLGLTGPWLQYKLIDLGLVNFRFLSLSGSVLGMFLGGALVWLIFNLYFVIRKEEGIGGGDFTLLSMIGAFLGWRAVFVSLFLGAMIALVAVLIMAIKQGNVTAKTKLPFGPFLSLAAIFYLFFGERLLRWYLS